MKLNAFWRNAAVVSGAILLVACQPAQQVRDVEPVASASEQEASALSTADRPAYYGTRLPFAAEAIYFAMTDRFVDGDPTNNHEQQGGDFPTWQGKMPGPDGQAAYVGYMGGDFKGVLDNAGYIRDMGFTAIWLTPILDNPDQAFSGGEPIEFGGMFKDGGKTGYHGYWANNFYKVDEHYPSEGLDYKTFTDTLRNEYGIKTIFDVVGNHGSPSFSMPVDQPKFGELYDLDGNLVADHQNIEPEALNDEQPLHDFFHREKDIAQLSNLDDTNPAVQDYLINSYLYWIEQGADAFRIDTIKHVPHHFWKLMADRIRSQHPDFFMFAESFDYNANFIAQHTLPKNGEISVLDFPGQGAMTKVFENPDSDFSELLGYLHLTHGPYHNPYDLTTFYDNHDMARMNASDQGFINANNWLFTSRGIPVVYQGSEIGFMRGTAEHAGNRNYFGQANINSAPKNPIHQALTRIANVRKQVPALQRGLQVNLIFEGQQAAFYRVLQDGDIAQTALVLLNKSSEPAEISVQEYIQNGNWQEQLSMQQRTLQKDQLFSSTLAANGVQVWVREGEVDHDVLEAQLDILMNNK